MKIFSFNENRSGTLIDSVSKTAGTLTAGNGGFRRTEKGQALLCDGALTRITGIPITEANTCDVVTVFMWTSKLLNWQNTIISKGYQCFELSISSTKLDGYIGGSVPNYWIPLTTFNLSHGVNIKYPNQFVVVIDFVKKTISFYCNGEYKGSSTNSNMFRYNSLTATIGQRATLSGNLTKGNIHKISMFSGTPSLQEVKDDYKQFLNASTITYPTGDADFPKPTDLSSEEGLVAAYIPSIKTVVDGEQLLDIAGSKHGTINGATFTKDGMKFDGVDDKISCGNIVSTYPYTMVVRCKVNSGPAILISNGDSGSGAYESIFYNDTSGGTISVSSSDGSSSSMVSYNIGSFGEVVDIIGIWNSASSRELYVNGIYIGIDTTYKTVIRNNVKIGVSADNSPYGYSNGEIYDARIYNYAFTPSQAKAYHNSFVKPVLIEDFRNHAIGNSPSNWIKGTGEFEVKEITSVNKGTELITNVADREFTSDTGWWTKTYGWSIEDGVARPDGSTTWAGITRPATYGDWALHTFTISNYVSGGIVFRDYLTNLTLNPVTNTTYSRLLRVGSYMGFWSYAVSNYDLDNVSIISYGNEYNPYPELTVGTRYLKCTSSGTTKIHYVGSTDVTAVFYVYILANARWYKNSGTLASLISANSFLSYDGQYLSFNLATGDFIANINIANGVKQ